MRCSLGRVGRQGAQQGLEKGKVRADHDQQGRPRVRAGSHGSSGAPERSSPPLSPFSPPSSLPFLPSFLSPFPSRSFLFSFWFFPSVLFFLLSCALPHTSSPSSLILCLPALSFSFPQVLTSVYRLSLFPSPVSCCVLPPSPPTLCMSLCGYSIFAARHLCGV